MTRFEVANFFSGSTLDKLERIALSSSYVNSRIDLDRSQTDIYLRAQPCTTSWRNRSDSLISAVLPPCHPRRMPRKSTFLISSAQYSRTCRQCLLIPSPRDIHLIVIHTVVKFTVHHTSYHIYHHLLNDHSPTASRRKHAICQ